jgi:hypothetical protein
MKQEIADLAAPQPQPKKVKRGGTTYASKLGDWQSFLAPLATNAADLPHLEIPRTQLAALLAQAVELKNQQATERAAKQGATQQLQTMVLEGQRLAALLRQALKQHYGPRSEKLAEFGLQPFRGRAKSKKTPPTPAPSPEATAPSTPS